MTVSRYFISSSREFIADAEAIRLTHNPAALISALSKVEGRSHIYGTDKMIQAMMFDGPATGDLLSHPPIDERIKIINRYAGSMVHGAAKSADTRSFGTRRAPNSFAVHIAQTKYREDTKRSVLGRLQLDSRTNLIGLPKGVTNTLLCVVMGFIGIQALQYQIGKSTEKKFGPAAPYASPIIKISPAFVTLELNGNGPFTTRVTQSKAYFKMKISERAYRTGWLEPSSGFLFFDANGNNKMDGVLELVSISSNEVVKQNGFAALKRFDSNFDGKLTKVDTHFSALKIWRDYNNDGIFDEPESFSLSDLDIDMLHLSGEVYDSPEGRKIVSGARLYRHGTYQSANGTGRMIMIAFETDRARYRNAQGDRIEIFPEQPKSVAQDKQDINKSSTLRPSFSHISSEIEKSG